MLRQVIRLALILKIFALSLGLAALALATDEAALLTAIERNPDEDTPRLVYADWLDEHATDESQSARAEFIRLQIDLNTRSDVRSEDFRVAKERAEVLLGMFGNSWTPEPLCHKHHVTDYGITPTHRPPVTGSLIWRRGFIERVILSSRDFRKPALGEALSSLPGLDGIDIESRGRSHDGMTDFHWRQLSELAVLPRLRGFSTDEVVNARWNSVSERLINVERLHVDGACEGMSVGFATSPIAASILGRHARKLRALSLRYVHARDIDFMEQLWGSTQLNRLETLGIFDAQGLYLPYVPDDALPALRNIQLRGIRNWEEVGELARHPHFRKIAYLRVAYGRMLDNSFAVEAELAAHGLSLVDVDLFATHVNGPMPPLSTALEERIQKNRAQLGCDVLLNVFGLRGVGA